MRESFKTIGNLAFYDGWSPNYFYFNTLRNAGTVFEGNDSWNASAAERIAQEAIGHAEAHMHLNGLSKDDADIVVREKFEAILSFLDVAYAFEFGNEQKYFKQKLKEIKETFTEEELKQIKPLTELLSAFDGRNAAAVDYNKIITLINILLQGISNTKTIAKYEEEHIKQIDEAVEKILNSREGQTSGLAHAQRKSTDERIAMMLKSRGKLKNQITATYLEHKNISSTYQITNGKRKSYVWGAKTYTDKIQSSVDVAIARWATETLDKIINSPEILDRLAKKLNAEYPENGNFYDLEEKVKGSIIVAVTQYGVNNIGKILDAKITKRYANSIAREIIEDGSLFNTTESYRIEGLYDNFGQYGHVLELFKNARNIEDLRDKSAEKLYDGMNKLIRDMNSERGLTKEQTFLKEVYKKNKSWASIEDMMNLIHRLEDMRDKVDSLQKKLDQEKISIEKVLKTTISAGGSKGGKNYMELKLEVVDGKINIVMNDPNSSLGQMISSTADFRRFGFTSFNPNSLKGAIMTLKTRASQNLKNKLIEGIEATLNDGNLGLDHDYVLSQIKQGFQNLKVSIGGPKLSELAAGLNFRKAGNDLVVDWAGGINGKNDVVTITVNAENVARSIKLQLRDNLDKKVAAVVEPEIMEARKQFLEQWNMDVKDAIKYHTRNDTTNKYSEIKDVFLNKKSTMSDKLSEKYQELERIWKTLEKEMIAQGKSQEEITNAQKKFLNVLGDSFYVSTTVKTYNEYQNDIGFGGGSIGTSLDDQLARLSDIFEQGGLSIKDDIEWLKFAIVNCSPLSVLKETNKNLIEDYLGSLAAFTLFDEGGAEAAIIHKFQERLMKNQSNMGIPGVYSNPSILHLYKVNGIYVPGSYVLQQVQKCIARDILPQIDQISTTLNHGAGITIINQVDTSIIPNRPISTTINPNPAAWAIAGSRAKDKVKIQVLFLAGLLDIVRGINKEMGNIELPV